MKILQLFLAFLILAVTAPPAAAQEAPADNGQLLSPENRDFLGVPESQSLPGDKQGVTKPSIDDSIILEGEQNKPVDPMKEAMAKALKRLESFPPDVQEIFKEEADKAFEYCEGNNALYNFYDCSCFALRIMDERIVKGPERSFGMLVLDGKFQECASPVLVVGYSDDWCRRMMLQRMETQRITDETCSCLTKSMSRKFRNNPRGEMSYISKLLQDTLVECRAPLGYEPIRR